MIFAIYANKKVIFTPLFYIFIMEGCITLAIIKPDAVEKDFVGPIITRLQQEGFKIAAMKMLRLTKDKAEEFYQIHKGKDFYEKLIEFMISGPIVPLLLVKENAVQGLRRLLGATNSLEAAEGTIRNMYGTDGRRNAIHGSDSDENAQKESEFFFLPEEIIK